MTTQQLDSSDVQPISDTNLALFENVNKMLKSLEAIFQQEGGRAELVSVTNAVARIKVSNDMCEGCTSSFEGMQGGLRLMLLERVTGLSDVIFE